jgi:CubicO group peptidase (beta-lactamase class C family)
MQLVEAGSVDLAAPVQRYLPWFRLADGAASVQITVAQCLHHTSGIPHDADFRIRLATEDVTGPTSVEQGVRALSAVTLRDAPGASFQYTNLGYNILGAIVEAVSGQPYADYLATHVFGPLQMTHTYTTIDQARSGGLAEGFSTVFGTYWQRPVSTPEALQPSATTFSSAEDVAHEIEMYLAAGTYHGIPLISPDTEKTLHAATPVNGEVSYSMGWWLRPQWELSADPGNPTADAAVATVIEHGGDWDNTVTYMGYVPASGQGLVVLINANSATEGSEIQAIPGNAWRVLLGVPAQPVVPQEDFLQRFGWQIAAAIVAVQLLVAVGTVFMIRRRSRSIPSGADPRRRWLLGLPLILDGGVLLLGLVLIPTHFDSPFLDLLSDSPPDVAGLVLAALAIAVTSAVTRIVLLIRDRKEGGPTKTRSSGATSTEAPVLR